MTLQDLLNELGEIIAQFPSQKTAAKKLGVSPQYLNDVVQKRREPGPKLLKAMKLRRVESYEKK
jgi:DNA-binding transcriptional regulator YdaS (Cro superfamily)